MGISVSASPDATDKSNTKIVDDKPTTKCDARLDTVATAVATAVETVESADDKPKHDASPVDVTATIEPNATAQSDATKSDVDAANVASTTTSVAAAADDGKPGQNGFES